MEDDYRRDSYDILCRFIDDYLNLYKVIDLRLQPKFWEMIQKGLSNGVGIVTKRCSFLLRKCILFSSSSDALPSPTK